MRGDQFWEIYSTNINYYTQDVTISLRVYSQIFLLCIHPHFLFHNANIYYSNVSYVTCCFQSQPQLIISSPQQVHERNSQLLRNKTSIPWERVIISIQDIHSCNPLTRTKVTDAPGSWFSLRAEDSIILRLLPFSW